MSLKVFLTEFRFQGTIHEGPNIIAESFEEAEEQAEHYGVIVVGMLDGIISVEDLEAVSYTHLTLPTRS